MPWQMIELKDDNERLPVHIAVTHDQQAAAELLLGVEGAEVSYFSLLPILLLNAEC